MVAQHRREDAVEGASPVLLAHARSRSATSNDKAPIEPGHVYLAPPDYHLLVEPGYFSLSKDEHVHYARPSIDVLFESAADAYRERVIGVILTGRQRRRGGRPRADQAARRRGGRAGPGRPSARDAGCGAGRDERRRILPLREIGPFLYGLVRAGRREDGPTA